MFLICTLVTHTHAVILCSSVSVSVSFYLWHRLQWQEGREVTSSSTDRRLLSASKYVHCWHSTQLENKTRLYVNGFASTVPCQPSRLLVSYDMFDTLTPQHISTRPPSRPGLMRQVKVGGLSGGAGGRGGRGRREEQHPSDTAEEDTSP